METLPLFPLEEFERESGSAERHDAEGRESEVGELGVASRPAINRDAGWQVDLQGVAGEREGGPTSNRGTGKTAETRWPYRSTGLQGSFPLSPLSLLFPDLSQRAFESLTLDISENGLLEEITVAGDPPHIVDGKHRLRASERAGVDPSYRLLQDGIDPRDYVWARNGERRDLTKSQRALVAAELFSFPGPGRPRTTDENSAVLQDYPGATMDRIAGQGGFSVRLLSDATKIANKDGPAVSEVRDAVRQGVTTVTDAAQGTVLRASPEAQRQAVALVRNGEARTVAAAVGKVSQNLPVAGGHDRLDPDPPASFGEQATFHRCSVSGLVGRIARESVDLIVTSPPRDTRLTEFSDLAALAGQALTPEGLLVVAILCRKRFLRIPGRMEKSGLELIIDLSLVFPTPVSFSGEPHRIGLRRVPLLVLGKPGARIYVDSDVIEVPPSPVHADGSAPGVEDGMGMVVRNLASRGQVVCDPVMERKQRSGPGSRQGGVQFHRRCRGPRAHRPVDAATCE